MPNSIEGIKQSAIDSLKNYSEELLKGAESAVKLLESSKKLQEVLDALAKTEGSIPEKKKKLTAIEKEELRIKKGLVTTQAKLTKAKTAAAVELTKERIKLQEVNKEVKKNITISKQSVLTTEAQKGAYDAISASLSANLVKWKKLSAVERETTKEGKKLTATIKKQRAELTRLDAGTGTATRGVAKYKEGIIGAGKALVGAFGVTLGLAAFVAVMGKAVKVSIEFESKMSKVKALSGATNKEFALLKNQAKELGENTNKTAAEAAQLAIELSKLGFSAPEILKAQDAMLQLSIATGEDLAESARVAAGTLKAFGARAKDTEKFTNVMAKAFSSSALDLAKFETASSAAAPTLSAMGVTVEEMSAQLSVLVDRNIDASTAGTGLRNVYLDLNKNGLTYKEALDKINNSSNKANTAFELFGKRGATVAVVLAENQEEAKKLTKEYENSAGAAKKMADIMQNNLLGDTDKATSAMEGLAINLSERVNPQLRASTQAFTDLVSAISEMVKIDASEIIKEERVEVNKLAIELTNSNTTQERRNEIYNTLNDIAPDVIKNIDKESVSIVQLKLNLEKYNQTVIKRLALEESNKTLSKANEKAGNAAAKVLEREEIALELLVQTRLNATKVGGKYKEQLDEIAFSTETTEEKLKAASKATLEHFQATIKGGTASRQYSSEFARNNVTAGQLVEVLNNLKGAREDETAATEVANAALKTQTDRYDRLFGAIDAAREAKEKETEATALAIREAAKKVAIEKDAATESKKTNDELNKAKVKSDKLAADVSLQIEKDENKEWEKDEKDTHKEILKNQKDFTDQGKKLAKELTDFEKAENDKKKDLAKSIKDAKIALAKETVDALFQIGDDQREVELEKVEAQREEDLERITLEQETDLAKVDQDLDHGVISEETASLRKKEINDKANLEKDKADQVAAKKEREIKIKQAKSDKAAALIGIAINTALGIVKTIGQVGMPAAIPLIALTAGLGVVQAAVVAAQPIPEFFKGTKSAPDGTISAGEKGREIVVKKDGQAFLTPDTTTYYTGLGGAEIIPNKQTEQILSGRKEHKGFDASGILSEMKKQTKVMKRRGGNGTHTNGKTTIKNAFTERFNLN